MKICPNCGTPARMKNQKFCTKCGTRLPDTEPAPQPEAAKPARPAEPDEPVTPKADAKPAEEPESGSVTRIRREPRPVQQAAPEQPEPAKPAEEPESSSVTRIRREPRPVQQAAPEQPEPAKPAEEPESSSVTRIRREPRPVQQAAPEQPEPAKPAEEPESGSVTRIRREPRPVQQAAPEQPEPAKPENRMEDEEEAPVRQKPRPVRETVTEQPPKQQDVPEINRQPAAVRKTSPLTIVLICLVGLLIVIVLGLSALLFMRGNVPGNLPFLSDLLGVTQQTEQTPESALDELAPSATDTPPAEDIQTEATPAPTATPVPTATPAPTPVPLAEDQRFYLENLMVTDDLVVTADGVPVSCYSDGTRMYIDRSALQRSDTMLRAILPDGIGGYITSLVRVSQPGDGMATFGSFYSCDQDGYLQPDLNDLQLTLSVYYDGYLNTINTKDMGAMRCSTATNNAELTQKINSSANTGVTYNLEQSDMICDSDSVVYGDRVVTLNARSNYLGTEHTRNSQISGDNYMTVQLTWQDGMWQVNHCIYITEEEYNAGTLSPMP